MKKEHNLCSAGNSSGCNKCLLNCPVYSNYAIINSGSNKINIDNTICTSHGLYIMISDRVASSIECSIDKLFADVSNGKKVSLIVIPSIVQSIPNYKRLFSYLKAKGVNLIYDGSFGTDIMIWGNSRVVNEQNIKDKMINPCQIMVSYAEYFEPQLIQYFVPIQTPAICAAIYLDKYMGVTDSIAVLSDCISQTLESNELNAKRHIEYNFTFDEMLAYLAKQGVDLSKYDEIPFDSIDSYEGTFSQACGFSDSIQFFLDSDSTVTPPKGIDQKLAKQRFVDFSNKLKLEDFARSFRDKRGSTSEADQVKIDKLSSGIQEFIGNNNKSNCFMCGVGNCAELAKEVVLGKDYISNSAQYKYAMIPDTNVKLASRDQWFSAQNKLLASKNKELLEAIEYTRIVEEQLKLEKAINDFALQTKYELIALIDVGTGAFTAYKMSKVFQNGGLHNKMNFNKAAVFVNQKLVHEDDRENFKQQNLDYVIEELGTNGELLIEFRLLDAETNSYHWKRVSYRYFDKEKKCVIQLTEDIHKDMIAKTQLEEQNEKLLLNDKCFKALSEHTNKVVFEWDFSTEVVTCMSNFKAIFGRDAVTRTSADDALAIGYVHIDDQETFKGVFDVLRAGNPINDIRFRVLDAQNIYRWCSLSGIVIKDDNGNRYKAIGILESIAKQLDKEEKLRKRAERDQLTGVYNKITSEMLIKNIIADSDIATHKHALMIIDIDNYKNINDKFGHLYGDFILAQLSLSLNSLFRESDVVGRLGGDEFFVFITNYSNENVLIEKSKEICKIFHKSYFKAGRNETISASIGIAKFPEHGQNFETLYRNADIALYGVKMNGKNNYKIYNGEKDIEDYISDRTDIDTVNLVQKNFMENRAEYVFRLLYETSIGGGNINSALQFITEHFGFSRGYIFETDCDGKCTNNTHEWCADGIPPEIDSLQNIPIECITTANNSFIKSGVFVIDDISTMPKIESEVLARQGIKSMFQFGIMIENKPIGFIGFDDCVNKREPSDVDIEELKLICNIFATFLIKQRNTEIAELNYKAIRSILDNFEGYAYVIDKDTYQVVFENTQISDYLGESSVGKRCYEQYMSRTSPCTSCPIKGLLDSTAYGSEKEFLHGTTHHSVERQNAKLGIICRSTASVIEWSDGKEKHLMSNVDISKYKNENKEFKEHFRELLSLTKLGTWDWDIKTGEATFSKEWAEILGYSLEELNPHVSTWKMVVLPSDLESATEQMKLHFSGKNTLYEAEIRMVRKDGEVIWAQDKGYVSETDEDGNPTHFTGILQDLSRLKHTEIELNNNQEALDLAMNIAELGTWDLDITGNRVTYNDDYLNMIGLTQSDVDGSIEEWESSIHPDDLPRISQLLQAYLAGHVDKYECEMRLQHRDGHYIWTRDVGRIVSRDADGKPTRLIGGNLNIDTLKRTQEQLNKLAYYDELTGAPNLTKFKIECQRFIDENKDKKFLMVKFDLQEFKLVNQILGEKVGDKVIISLAKSLKINTPGDYERYARLHDDEFLVLHVYDKVEEIIETRDRYKKLLYEEMGEDFNYDIKMVSGHYYMSNDNCYSITEAIEKANIAHGLAKKQHLEICVYDQDFTNEALKKMKIESRATQALKNKEFKVFLQPKYELFGETIVGAEALVRWIDNTGVMVYPNEFISIFEHNRFITQLDFYMFEESCKIIRSWIDNEIVPVPISVNFSRLHLFNSDFANILATIADKYDIAHHYLEIELTETIIMETEEKLNAFISSLHERGFLLSIDDFGTGYSSLGMLKNFNVDIIKLDRSFFVDANKNSKTHSILSNMLNMIIDLGIKTVAEGVEEKEHVDLLRKLNCDVIQGYYYSRPIPNEEFTKQLKVLTDTESKRNSDRQLRFNLRKNNELLTEMMDYMPLAFTLWDNRLVLVQCNKAAVTLLGYESEEDLIANNLKTMPKYQSDGSVSMLTFRGYIHKALESGYEECKTWNMLSATGVIIPCEIIFVKIINKGKFMVACYIHDISLLIKSENIIKQEHLKLEKMMNASPLCFNLWDDELCNTMCNKAAPELFDLPSEQDYLINFDKLSPLYQPDGRLSSEKAVEKLKLAFSKGKEVFQWMHQKLNGELIPAEITLVRIELNGKQVVAGFTRDMR